VPYHLPFPTSTTAPTNHNGAKGCHKPRGKSTVTDNLQMLCLHYPYLPRGGPTVDDDHTRHPRGTVRSFALPHLRNGSRSYTTDTSHTCRTCSILFTFLPFLTIFSV